MKGWWVPLCLSTAKGNNRLRLVSYNSPLASLNSVILCGLFKLLSHPVVFCRSWHLIFITWGSVDQRVPRACSGLARRPQVRKGKAFKWWRWTHKTSYHWHWHHFESEHIIVIECLYIMEDTQRRVLRLICVQEKIWNNKYPKPISCDESVDRLFDISMQSLLSVRPISFSKALFKCLVCVLPTSKSNSAYKVSSSIGCT